MEPLKEIKTRLAKHPDLEFVEGEDFIEVKGTNADGFDVSLHDHGEEIWVFYSGWHTHFKRTEAESALNCFVFGLSDKCRMKVCSRTRAF